MNFVTISQLVKNYGTNKVVRGLDLGIRRGEFVSLLGPSGCGKTTVLRMVAGFETASSGTITIDGENVTSLTPAKRNVGMVFQAYALFPNMTVTGNVGFGMKIAGRPAAETKARVAEMLDLVKLSNFGDRYPYQLSGGQQQRVALARALAIKPRVLLLDEPLSALDAKIRVSLREEIRAMQRDLGITTIFVTHDQEEALSISDRIVVMNAGNAEQVGTPFEIYNRPSTKFVAGFVGTLNQFKAVRTAGGYDIEGQLVSSDAAGQAAPGTKVTLALRPEAMSLEASPQRSNSLRGIIEEVSFLGSVVRIRVAFGSNKASFDIFNNPNAAPPQRGAEVLLHFNPDDILVLAA